MRPFDDFRALLSAMPGPDNLSQSLVRKKFNSSLPEGYSLETLKDLAVWYLGWRGKEKESINQPLMAVFAGNHGTISGEDAVFKSRLRPQWTQEMVDALAQNKVLLNHVCRSENLHLRIFDLALEYPVMDFSKDAAMDERSCAATMAYGMEAIAGEIDLLCLSGIGAGSNLSCAAIAHILTGCNIEDCFQDTLSSEEKDSQTAFVKLAIENNCNLLEDSFEVLRYYGGREIAALVGAILAARMEKIPVILDDYVALTAAALLYKLQPASLDHCIVSYRSTHKIFSILLEFINKKPLLILEQANMPGIAAGIAVNKLRTALACAQGISSLPELFE